MNEREIQEMVKTGLSHSNISYILRRRHPGVKGFSERSGRRFCPMQNIYDRSALSDFDMRLVVRAAVREVICSLLLNPYKQMKTFAVSARLYVGWSSVRKKDDKRVSSSRKT